MKATQIQMPCQVQAAHDTERGVWVLQIQELNMMPDPTVPEGQSLVPGDVTEFAMPEEMAQQLAQTILAPHVVMPNGRDVAGMG